MGLLLRGRGLYLLTDMSKILHTLDLCKVVGGWRDSTVAERMLNMRGPWWVPIYGGSIG